MVDYVTTSLVLIPTHMQECVLATGLTDTTPTGKKMADITECCRRVGPTLSTCQQQTKMSVVGGVEPTDTNPDIASQAIRYCLIVYGSLSDYTCCAWAGGTLFPLS